MLHNIFFSIDVCLAKIRLDQKDSIFQEGGPNWEIFNPKGNRFYLPNSGGPWWQNERSTISTKVNLNHLIDFDSKVNSLVHAN